MATQWYVNRDGRRMGPYSGDELQQFADAGRLAASDLVWCEGMTDWVEAKKVLKPSSYLGRPSPRYAADEERDYEEARRPERGPPSEFPGRLITPGFFLFALLMFFLPWVDVRCNGFTVITQSGLQAGLGTYSESFVFAQERRRNQPAINETVPIAPLMLVYGGLLLAGIAMGLAIPAGWGRMIGVGSVAFIAFVLIIVQVSVGFPINAQVAKANADPNLQQNFGNPAFPGPMPPGPGAIVGPHGELVWCSTTPWLWLGALFTVGTIGGLALEHCLVFAKIMRRRRCAAFAD